MLETKEINLYDFMPDSLNLHENTKPFARSMISHKDYLTSFYEEDPDNTFGGVNFIPRTEPENKIGTPIQEFFRGANVFITGGSGFIGKVLIDKLVTAVPHLGQIYLLIRPKRGMSCEQRFEKLIADKVFSRMKAEVPHYLTKLRVLAGDITEPGLGLSDEDRLLLLNTVHVVFHCAADVRFLEPLKSAIVSNVLGAKHILDLAKEMTHLKAYIHVSTAFSQCVHRVIEEIIPKMNVNYKEVLHFVDSNSDDHIEKNIKRILQGWPNTYTFTKALCEDMIQEEAERLPICIFRPSIIMNTYKEPLKGWIDNLYGPMGICLGAALGILHCTRVDRSNTAEVVPADYVVNCMIASAWETGTEKENGCLLVHNFTSSLQNRTTWCLPETYESFFHIAPSNKAIWYPSFFRSENYYFMKFCNLILHRIPGFFLDKLAERSGNKMRLIKLYDSIDALEDNLWYFKDGSWEFRNANVINLWNRLTIEDKKIFNFDVRDICWGEIIHLSWLGFRTYYLKEKLEDIPAAKKRFKWLYAAHVSLKLLCGYAVLKTAAAAAHMLPI